MPITALPIPPSRNDPANFAVRGDAFLGALPTFQSEANALQVDVGNKQTSATASAAAALASENAAASTAGVTIWVSGTTYSIGNNRFDPVDFKTYRRTTAGAGTTRPGLDGTNWALLTSLGDATLAGNQTFTGVKTFSQTIQGSVSGNAGTATVAAALSDASVLVPTGSITYLGGGTAPSGWLKANGAAVSRTTYAALFSVIGVNFGNGDGSTTFNLPDLRGEFIRGLDDLRGVDSLRTIGSFQADEFKSHVHSVEYGSAANTSSVYPSRLSNGAITYVNTAAAGGSETRPRNIALLAIIKF